MKVVILAGGYGTRISEESHLKPKPMIEIGEKPILWHIMKIYSSYGFNDFVICLGYKGFCIKEYFVNYFLHNSDITLDFRGNDCQTEIHSNLVEPWRVTLVETGLSTMTGGRLKRVASYLKNEPFLMTYGDGVADINIAELVKFHKAHGKLCTVTATQPGGRFGAMDVGPEGEVRNFKEKPKGDSAWVNGGFFVMQPEVLNYIADDKSVLEAEPLENLADQRQLVAFHHHGFWQPMDTLRDKVHLDSLLKNGEAPWVKWSNVLPFQPLSSGASKSSTGSESSKVKAGNE